MHNNAKLVSKKKITMHNKAKLVSKKKQCIPPSNSNVTKSIRKNKYTGPNNNDHQLEHNKKINTRATTTTITS